MQFCDLAINQQFTTAPSGNGTLYTKISRWRASYTAMVTDGEVREVIVKTTVTNQEMPVYAKPGWHSPIA